MATEKSNFVYDEFATLSLGMDSGSAVEELPKNQCAFAVNKTFRGKFAKVRPRYQKVKLASDIDSLIQDAFSKGLFQGAGSYKPDFVSEQLCCSIAGRQFLITPSADSDVESSGKEITIAGDLNPSNISPVWFTQGEQFLIVNDGQSVPIFYDGNTSRRSQVDAKVQGETAADFDVPPIGGQVDITLVANYTGLLNSVLNLDEIDAVGNVRKTAQYMVVKVGGAVTQYQVTLKRLTGTSVGYSDGNALVVQPSNLGEIKTVSQSGNNFTVHLSAPIPQYVIKGMSVLVNNNSFSIISVANNFISFVIKRNSSSIPAPAIGDSVTLKNFPAANVSIGILAALFTAPAIGSNGVADLVSQFVSANGTILFIGNDQYQVISSSVNPPAANTSIRIQNLSDTADIDPTTGNTFLKVLTGSKFYNLPELPPARMGAYGMGRIWQSGIDGISFLAGDIVGGASGSPAYNYRDAVLKVTENDYLAGGGTFSIPSSGETITGMIFPATLDVSLGQGALQIFTNQNVFSCNTPVDRSTWTNLTNPILTVSLKGNGASSAWGITNVNSDILFRSPNGELRSMKFARVAFNDWPDSPISYEMERVIDSENFDFLNLDSAINFDRRWLVACNPVQGTNCVYWQGIIAYNLDPSSSSRQKLPSIYDGLWTGLNIIQLVKFRSVERAFAFCFNTDENKIEVYEIKKTGDGYFDNGTVPIVSSIESPPLFLGIKRGVNDILKLEGGEILLSDIIGRVDIKIQYRADYDSCWHDWHSWYVCAKQGTDENSSYPQYRQPMGFGSPKVNTDCNINTEMLPNWGDFFQVKVIISGQCIVKQVRVKASLQPHPDIHPPICNNE